MERDQKQHTFRNHTFGLLLTCLTAGALQAQVKEFDLTCSSDGYAYIQCTHPQGFILKAKVQKQFSKSECKENVGWAVREGLLWVDAGCRANFRVTVDTAIPTPKPDPGQDRIEEPVRFANLKYSKNEEHQVISKVPGGQIPYFHGTAALVKNHLVIPFANNVKDGGFGFFNLQNPKEPKYVSSIRHSELREGHAIGFQVDGDRIFAAALGSYGVLFFDFTNPKTPKFVSKLDLKNIEPSDYDNGAWWLYWQAPYLYVGGSSRGLYIIDTTVITAPKVLNHLLVSQTGGYRVGPVFALGNLLVSTANDVSGISTFDISDPSEPQLLYADKSRRSYSSMVYDNKLLLAGAGNWLGGNGLYIYDLTNPSKPSFLGSRSTSDKGGYLTIQDSIAHLGSSDAYYKIDFRNPRSPELVSKTQFGTSGADLDFVSVLGNLAILGDDHGHGSRIAVHSANPDHTPPAPTGGIYPKPGSRDNSVLSRITISFSDAIDLSSIKPASIRLVDITNAQVVPVFYSSQTGLVNMSPRQPLRESTKYEIVLTKGGIKDVAGNGLSQEYKYTFETNSVGSSGIKTCRLENKSYGGSVAFEGGAFLINLEGCDLSKDISRIEFENEFGNWVDVKTSDLPIQVNTHKQGTKLVRVRITGTSQFTEKPQRILTLLVKTVSVPTGKIAPKSSTLAASVNSLWFVNSDGGTVTELIRGNFPRKGLEIPVGSNPQSVAVDKNANVWVTLKDEDSIALIDIPSTTSQNLYDVQKYKLPWGSAPHGIVYSALRDEIYVALEGRGEILILKHNLEEGFESIATLSAKNFSNQTEADHVDFRSLSLNQDQNLLLATRFRSPKDHGEIYAFDLNSRSLIKRIDLAYDNRPDTESNGSGVPNYLSSITISRDGKYAYVTSKKDNTNRGVYLSNQKLSFENSVRTIVSVIDLESLIEKFQERIDLNDRNLAWDIDFSAIGDYLFVATAGSNTVDIVDSITGETISSLEDVGSSPQGLYFDQNTSKLYVHNVLDRAVKVFSTEEIGKSNNLGNGFTIKLQDHELLAPEILFGKKVFFSSADSRMSQDKYLSCASCHFDGDSDNRVWDFTERGEGLRNTTTLEGKAGTKHGFLHWTANFDEIQDFEHDIRGGFGGSGFIPNGIFNSGGHNQSLGTPKKGLSPELDALAAYVSSLEKTPRSPYREISGGYSSIALNGKAVFERVGCAKCHAGEEYTDSASGLRHDVGTLVLASGKRMNSTLDGLDTPTLRGIWKTAPYLHDGSAATLYDVLVTKNREAKHADLRDLDPKELSALIEYLQQIE